MQELRETITTSGENMSGMRSATAEGRAVLQFMRDRSLPASRQMHEVWGTDGSNTQSEEQNKGNPVSGVFKHLDLVIHL